MENRNHCFVIAEAGVNHNGDLNIAERLIDIASEAGADAVKFQTFSADDVVTIGTGTVEYQRKNTGEPDQHRLLQMLEFSSDEWEHLSSYCARVGIEFMSTAFDMPSFELLQKLDIKRIKIPSGEVTNHPLIRQFCESGLPVILSSGMASLDELSEAAELVRQVQGKQEPDSPMLTVLQCTSAYPTPAEEANLTAMHTIADALDARIGFSDHTTGTLLAPVAVGMGASMIEKHFTLDRSLPGPDHQASLEPDELKAMIADIRKVEASLGTGIKEAQPSELETRSLARRGIKVVRDLQSGQEITKDDIAILRPETGLAPKLFDSVIGKRVSQSVPAGKPLDESFLEI